MLVGYRVFFVEGDNDSSAAGMDIRQFDQHLTIGGLNIGITDYFSRQECHKYTPF